MPHFAKVENGIVTQVIVAEQEFIDSGALGDPTQWIQTSYNTICGVHTNGGTPLRGNFAGIGMIYDRVNDVFYSPKPHSSWTLNHSTWTWEAPTPYPTDGKSYHWDETTKAWVLNSQS